MKVTLLTHTHNMVEWLWTIWQLSRSNDLLEDIDCRYSETKAEEFFARIINEDIPLTEMIDFIFLLEDIPISLREQLVRHRVGVKVGGHDYVDTVSDLSDSSFWSQSMRVMDMSSFGFFVPESIRNVPLISKRKSSLAIYQEAMDNAAQTYSQLVKAGIPREDARNVIPLGATHRIIWKLNLSSLKHIVGKRSCWILQLGLWKPIIQGMIAELCNLDPAFCQLATPPCMKGNQFSKCLFCANNYARVEGDVDSLPPCPLFLNYYKDLALKCSNRVFPESKTCWYFVSSKQTWECCNIERILPMAKMASEYSKFWNRDVNTGEML